MAAMETCLQMSRVCNTGIGAIQSHHQRFSSKKPKLIKLQTFKDLKNPAVTLSSSSSLAYSNNGKRRKTRIVCQAKALNEVQVVTDSSWNNLVIGNENPVLVEFWAPWCGPCRMIAPVVDELAKEYAGKIACYKVNTDDCPNIASQYGIRSIPTVLFFKDGQKKESVIGAVPKSTLSATIDKYIGS